MSPKMKTPPKMSSKGKLLSLSRLQTARQKLQKNKLLRVQDLIVSLYLFQASIAIVKYTAVSTGSCIIYIQLEAEYCLCRKCLATIRQFIARTPSKLQMMDRLLRRLPTTMERIYRKQMPGQGQRRGFYVLLQICQMRKAEVESIRQKLRMTARSRLCYFQSSRDWLMFPQQSQTQKVMKVNEKIEAMQSKPLQ